MQSKFPIFTSLREASKPDCRIEDDDFCIKQPCAIYLARYTPCEAAPHVLSRRLPELKSA